MNLSPFAKHDIANMVALSMFLQGHRIIICLGGDMHACGTRV